MRGLVLAIILVAFSLLAIPFFIAQVHAAEPSLIEVFNYYGFTNVSMVNAIDVTFRSGVYNITLYAEFAGYQDRNELSYYQIDTTTYNLVFSGPEGNFGYVTPPLNKTFSIDYEFGLSFYTPEGHRYFTQNSFNPDGQNHSKVYRNLDDPNMYLIGLENLYGAGDRDYQDMVVGLKFFYYQTYLTVNSLYDTPSGEGWYHNGTTVYATLTDGVIDHGNGTRRVFTHWSGDASGTDYLQSDPIYMDRNKTAIANWKTEYYLTVTSPYGTPGGEDWYESGTTAYATLDTETVDHGNGTRRVFTHWSGDASGTDYAQSDPIVMDGPKTAVANWRTQFLVTFNQTGLDASAVGTVVTFDSNSKTSGELPYSFWVDSFTVLNYSYSNVSTFITNKRFILTGITGPASPLIVISPVTITGNYKLQYYFTVTSPYDTPTPTSGWFDAGTPITASVTSPWAGPTGTRYLCTGWTGTRCVPASGTGTSVSFTINCPSSITWNWIIQYYLTVKTDPSGIASISGEGWYNASSNVILTAPTVPNYEFNYWDVDGASKGNGVNPITVTMNAPQTATAHYTYVPPLSATISPPSATIYLCHDSVNFTSNVTGGTPPYTYQWYLDGNPVSGANSSTWTFKPATTGVYYVYLKVTDSKGNSTQSTSSRIVCVSPVGGYSLSLAKPAANTPIVFYAIVLAMFSAVTSLIRRKRKQSLPV